MKAFLVTVNGRRVALAGIGDDGILTFHILLGSSKNKEQRLDMEIGGLISDTGTQVLWPSPEIHVGDEISIKIVEADSVDLPMD